MLKAAIAGTFATMLSLAVDLDSPRVIVVRAGHPGMLVHGSGTVDWVEPSGRPRFGPGRRALAAARDGPPQGQWAGVA